MLEGKRILVTGGAGFIGSNLCEYFIQKNTVRCLDNLITGKRENIEHLIENPNFEFIEADIRDYETCQKAVEGIDYVFHQAALGSVPRSIKVPLNTNAHNVTGFLNMIEASREAGVTRFIYATSSSTYGDHPALPKVEDTIGKPLSPYAVSKYVNELYAGVYARLYQMKIIGLRYFNVFGRRQDPKGAYAAVIPLFIDKLLKGEEVTINGDGTQTRDFTYIDNVIHANEMAAGANSDEALNNVYNIACGQAISLNQLVEIIQNAFVENGIECEDFKVNHGPERLGDIPYSYASIDKAKQMLGYNPKVSLQEGIKAYLEFLTSKSVND